VLFLRRVIRRLGGPSPRVRRRLVISLLGGPVVAKKKVAKKKPVKKVAKKAVKKPVKKAKKKVAKKK
jgi:hypothetical protein